MFLIIVTGSFFFLLYQSPGMKFSKYGTIRTTYSDGNETAVEHTVRLKSKTVKKYKQHYPLITTDAVDHVSESIEEGDILKLVDPEHRFIAKGYYGLQNKGIGWVLTDDANEVFDTAFFRKKLKKAIRERKPLYENPDTTAFRVFNAEGDGIGGVTIDYYDGYYLIQWYSKGIFTFQTYLLEAFEDLVEYKGIYQKKRFDKAGQYVEEDDFDQRKWHSVCS
jgi:23S rRNA (cytosine1962-C5)-methyltransferase